MTRATDRLSFLYAALFFELGVNLPYFPLWLHAQALKGDAIGIILAAPLIARIVANPIAAAYADKAGRTATTLVACALCVVVGTAFLLIADGFLPILLLVIAIGLAQGPLIALTDAVTLGALNAQPQAELRYGRIRLWGSASFALANIGAGWMLDWLPVSSVILLLLVASILTALAAAQVSRMPESRRKPLTNALVGPQEHPWILTFTIAGAALVQASHAAVYAFSALHWQSSGFSGGLIGWLWAIGIVSEIAFFSMIGLIVFGRRGAAMLLACGAALATMRWLGMALDPGVALLVGLQMIHGITFGATHLGSIFLLAKLAPREMHAQVQAWLAAVWAGLMAVLTALSGQLYDTWNEHVYYLMAAASGTGLLLLLLVAIRLRKDSPDGIALSAPIGS